MSAAYKVGPLNARHRRQILDADGHVIALVEPTPFDADQRERRARLFAYAPGLHSALYEAKLALNALVSLQHSHVTEKAVRRCECVAHRGWRAYLEADAALSAADTTTQTTTAPNTAQAKPREARNAFAQVFWAMFGGDKRAAMVEQLREWAADVGNPRTAANVLIGIAAGMREVADDIEREAGE